MKEYLLLIRNEANYWGAMTHEQQLEHMQKAAAYIQKYTSEGKMKSAQPLTMNGLMLQNTDSGFKDGPFVESKEVIGGFFHIAANDLDEALEIAKANPVFDDPGVRIEIREIMRMEGVN
jgi:hypothetical protein